MRRSRADSTAEAVRIMQASGKPIEPPSNVPLKAEDMPFFESVIAEFARAEWTAHQLELAAMLAKKMRLLRDEIEHLENEGFVGETANGTACQNPRIGAVRMLDTSIMSTRRSLSLHARARTGDNRNAGTRREKLKQAETDVDDSLIARPN